MDIWSDIACPWCYVGEARFDEALREFHHADGVEVRLRSFELDPSGTERTDVVSMLARRYGISLETAQANERGLGELAAAEGLRYRAEGRDTGSTFDPHRLPHLAAERGLADVAWQVFYEANCADTASIFERDSLVEAPVAAGLERGEVLAVLDDPDDYARQVRADAAEAASLGVRGVPFVVIDGRHGVSGAQPVRPFAEVLERAWSERHPAIAFVEGEPAGRSCGPDGCSR